MRKISFHIVLWTLLLVWTVQATVAEARSRRRGRRLRVAMRTSALPPAWTSTTAGLEEAPDAPDETSGKGGMARGRIHGQGTKLACLRELRRLKIPFRAAPPKYGIWLPVVLTGPMHGVRYKALYHRRPPLVDCQFALGLYHGAAVLARFGVTTVLYTSTYRPPPGRSWRSIGHHPQGMAIDVNEVVLRDGTRLNILKDWEKFYGGPGNCVGRPKTRKGALLRRMTCAMEDAHVFRRIISPDSDYAHRNHWHISGARLGEAFVRSRWCGRTLHQPLPGHKGFSRWYYWYSCWKFANPRARYRCYRRRSRRRPRAPVRYRWPGHKPRVAIWLKSQLRGPEPEPPSSAKAVALADETAPRTDRRSPRTPRSAPGSRPPRRGRGHQPTGGPR